MRCEDCLWFSFSAGPCMYDGSTPPCEESEPYPVRYTVMYEGYLFEGDKADGLNMHDYDNWDEVESLINAYGDVIEVLDHWYGVHWYKGEWI